MAAAGSLRGEGLGIAAGGPTVFLWSGERTARRWGSEPARTEPLLCDGWEDGVLELEEGALWLYGQGRAEIELEAPAPTEVTIFADGRALEPELRRRPRNL